MIMSFIYYVTLSKVVDSSFPQCNGHTGVQGGCLAFTPLDGYLKLWELISNLPITSTDFDIHFISVHTITDIEFQQILP